MTNIGPVLHLGFSLVLLWGLLFFCWRQYRLDSLREKLFAIRNELFFFAAEGKIAFGNPAYRTLRDLINGMIRYAHKLSATQLVVTVLAYSFRPDEKWRQPMKQWREDVGALPPELRDKLIFSHDEMFRAVMKHVAGGNIVLMVAFSLLKAIRFLVKTISGGTTQNLSVLEAGRDLNLNLIEAQALKEQELETRFAECEFATKG
jgi:hypothetical protein